VALEERVKELREKKAQALAGGGPDRIKKQHEAGKYTARERIELLCDPGTFHELDALRVHEATHFGMDKKKFLGDGVVTGWGQVQGRPVYLFAQDFTVLGGSLGRVYAEKICKVMDLALKNGSPVVGLNDSGGARIQEGVDSLGGYAEIFWRNTEASGVVPQISMILGPCAGGAVYSPALTDFVSMVRHTSHMFITGPDVIKTATGEEVTFDDLGGADVHASKSGVAHLVSDSEEESFEDVKRLLSYLPANNFEDPPFVDVGDDPGRREDELRAVIPNDPNKPYDMRRVIELIADKATFFEVQKDWAGNLVVGFARLAGNVVGIVANQPNHLAGVLDINASVKGARFVRFCDSFNIPLVTFVDVPGFLPGVQQEHGGIIRHGAKLLYAFCEATVPKITIITRKAYGGAYDVMSSKHIRGDLNYAWPSAEIAVMGPDGAVSIIFRNEILKDGPKKRDELVSDYRTRFATPYVAAEKGYLDDIIEPQETRPLIIRGLASLRGKRVARRERKHGNIPL
jgi:acetyl-CoA/propionyl-CoA carboxylase carboxyl transferase subunit